MKNTVTFLCMCALAGLLLTTPASAGTIFPSALGNVVSGQATAIGVSSICPGAVYCNGEVNGNLDAWTISGGYAVSNSFALGYATPVIGVAYGVWNFPGDSGGSVDWSILTGGPDPSAGGTVVASGHASSLKTVDLGIDSYGFDIQVDSFSLLTPLAAGTYFLELQNAAVPSGNPVYWDENDGPKGNGSGSIAWSSSIGYLDTASGCNPSLPGGYCSESFAIYGGGCCGPPVPEPGTLVLCGSGLMLLASVFRGTMKRGS